MSGGRRGCLINEPDADSGLCEPSMLASGWNIADVVELVDTQDLKS